MDHNTCLKKRKTGRGWIEFPKAFFNLFVFLKEEEQKE